MRSILLGLLLAVGIPTLPALAQDPAAFCPPVTALPVELGQKLPLPNRFENPTDFTVTFNITVENANIFNFPSLLTDPRFGTLVLKPHETRSIPDLGFPIPPSTPTGSDTLILDVFGNGKMDNVVKIWGPFRCGYQLTVLPPRDLIVVPVRWCVVEGSPQAEGKPGPKNNGGAFATVSGAKLLPVLQRVDDQIYFPSASTHVLFRHVPAGQGIPVIDNPPPPATGCSICKTTPGAFDPDQDLNLDHVIAQCRQAWNQLYPGQPGTLLINATAFPHQTSGVTPGFDKFTLTTMIQRQLCKAQAVLDVAHLLGIQASAVFDPAEEGILVEDSIVTTLGHELGHSLALGHGDGVDNDMDGSPAGTPAPSRRLYDAYCDPKGVNDNDFPEEDAGTTFHSLMDYSGNQGFTPLQRETLRSIAKLVPGSSFSGAADPSGSLVAPWRGCEPQCGIPADLFLTEAGMAETPPLRATTFWTEVHGPLPAGVSADYLVFADLDGNGATGCDPASLFPGHPGFAGAELVSRVTVSNVDGQMKASPAAWRCQGGTLVELNDPTVEASVFIPVLRDVPSKTPPSPHFMRVNLSLPDALRGDAADRVRLQAIAQRTGGGPADRLPATGQGGAVSLTPPHLPECTLARPLLAPGEKTMIRADGLSPDRPLDVLVGGQVVATGTTNATGAAAIELTVPAASRQGLRPVAVAVRGTVESAVCAVLVQGNAKTPATVPALEPKPTGAGWNNSDVTVRLAAADVPGGPGLRDITYRASGAQPIPETPVAEPAGMVPGMISLTREGTTNLSFFTTNRQGVAEAPQTVTVRIDKTPPAVTYTGNAGSYAVTADIDITCRAADALSGVAYTTCQDVKAPASTFSPGLNILSAEATDFAGNKATGTANFTVNVTFDSLCALTRRLVAPSASRALCRRLMKAKAYAEDAKRQLDAFIADLGKVRAGARPDLHQPQADLLIRLATYCAKEDCR